MTNNVIRGLLPDGHAPSVLREEIISLIKSTTPAQGPGGGPTATVTTGTVTLGTATSAAFEVLGDVSYAAGITWLGGQPPAGFRGVVALSRSTGGTVLGVWRAFSGAAPTPANPSPAPVDPASPTPAPVPPSTETVAYSFTWAHGGFYISPSVKSMFYKQRADGWIDAWQYPRREDTWEPVESTHATYREQTRGIRVQATAPAPSRVGDGFRFRTEAPLSGGEYVFVFGSGGASGIVIQDGRYAYSKTPDYAGVFGSAGTQYVDGSWEFVSVRAGDALEFVNEEDGYLTGRVVRSGGGREQIFSFKNAPKGDSTLVFHGWNFKKAKVEIIRGGK